MGRRTSGRETSQENIFFLNAFLRKLTFLASRQRFRMVLTCSWVSCSKNDTERLWNHLKKQVLEPKRMKFDQNSDFGRVRTCQDLSRRTSIYCKPAEIFFQELHLSSFISKFIIFWKIVSFIKYIYHCIKSYALLGKLILFIKSCVLLSKFIIFRKSFVYLAVL